MERRKSLIAKYLEASDRINAPVLLEDDTDITPIDLPYAFIQPPTIDLDEFSTVEEIPLSIQNVGGGLLVVLRVSSDADWIKIEDSSPKRALECSDQLIIKAKIDREKLPEGEHSGAITLKTEQGIYQIPVRVRVSKEDAALIACSNDIIDFGDLPIHKDFKFTFKAASAETVYLQGEMTRWELGRIPMKKDKDEFHVTIPLDDGEYLYQFDVDGKSLPDPDNQQRVIIGDRGFASKLVLNRFSRTIEIANVSRKAVRVELVPSWKGIELSQQSVRLGKGEKTEIGVRVSPSMMSLGPNSHYVDIQVKALNVSRITVRANGVADGPVAEVSPQELSLGQVFRGTNIGGYLNVKNTGKGTLLCDIMVERPWLEPQKFEVPQCSDTDVFIPVDDQQLPPGEHKANIMLQTNSYIYNTDRFSIPIEFQLISLQTEPDEIDLGVLWVGEPKEQRLHIRRSDGARVSINIEDLPPWLDVSPAGRQALSFRVNWDGLRLTSDQDLSAVVNIEDELSPLRKQIRVRGRVIIPHIAVDGLNFGGGRWKKKTLPMVVRNMGSGKLVIHRVEIDEDQGWLALDTRKRKNLPPEFLVTVDRRLIPKPDRYKPITGFIRIYSNDPVEPIIEIPVSIG